MNELELWVADKLNLSPLLVKPNGTADTCLVWNLDEEGWKEKPRTILDYYRPATEDEERQLLEAA